jgi:hypothetical protein
MYLQDTRRSTFDLRRARYFESREEQPRNQQHLDTKPHRKLPENPGRASS